MLADTAVSKHAVNAHIILYYPLPTELPIVLHELTCTCPACAAIPSCSCSGICTSYILGMLLQLVRLFSLHADLYMYLHSHVTSCDAVSNVAACIIYMCSIYICIHDTCEDLARVHAFRLHSIHICVCTDT